jgi:hypothetical protein
MQTSKLIVRGAFEGHDGLRVSEKELAMLSEIGFDQIPTATSFVEFISSKYSASPSGIWYTLKKLKKLGILDFTEKGEEYRPLSLTRHGVMVLRKQTQKTAARHDHAELREPILLKVA